MEVASSAWEVADDAEFSSHRPQNLGWSRRVVLTLFGLRGFRNPERRELAGAAGKGSLPDRLDSQKSGMREGDVDVSAWKETKDTRRHWEKEPGHLVVWWRAKWRCGCCDGRGNERGGGWGGAPGSEGRRQHNAAPS